MNAGFLKAKPRVVYTSGVWTSGSCAQRMRRLVFFLNFWCPPRSSNARTRISTNLPLHTAVFPVVTLPVEGISLGRRKERSVRQILQLSEIIAPTKEGSRCSEPKRGQSGECTRGTRVAFQQPWSARILYCVKENNSTFNELPLLLPPPRNGILLRSFRQGNFCCFQGVICVDERLNIS